MYRHDLSVGAFLALRNIFFASDGTPIPYPLRPKANVQDDPFDEFVVEQLTHRCLSDELDMGVIKSPGPLISPDLLIFRPSIVTGEQYGSPTRDLAELLAIEVKKLERTSSGRVARGSGMDYNTTPPCGTIRVYSSNDTPVDVRASYLFVCQETRQDGNYALTALTLCDGNVLNDDFELYLSIVGRRSKEIGLGTYGDGVNRVRPMLIFSNPLGSKLFDRSTMLIHEQNDLARRCETLVLAGVFTRSPQDPQREERTFYCYRDRRDSSPAEPFEVHEPFPTPVRSRATQGRGRFRLPWIHG